MDFTEDFVDKQIKKCVIQYHSSQYLVKISIKPFLTPSLAILQPKSTSTTCLPTASYPLLLCCLQLFLNSRHLPVPALFRVSSLVYSHRLPSSASKASILSEDISLKKEAGDCTLKQKYTILIVFREITTIHFS